MHTFIVDRCKCFSFHYLSIEINELGSNQFCASAVQKRCAYRREFCIKSVIGFMMPFQVELELEEFCVEKAEDCFSPFTMAAVFVLQDILDCFIVTNI